MLVFDTCACVAALYKGMHHLRNGSLRSSRLMRVLLRDSLAYFIMSVTSMAAFHSSADSRDCERLSYRVDAAMILADVIVWFYVRVCLISEFLLRR